MKPELVDITNQLAEYISNRIEEHADQTMWCKPYSYNIEKWFFDNCDIQAHVSYSVYTTRYYEHFEDRVKEKETHIVDFQLEIDYIDSYDDEDNKYALSNKEIEAVENQTFELLKTHLNIE